MLERVGAIIRGEVATAQAAAAMDPLAPRRLKASQARLEEAIEATGIELPACSDYAETADPAVLAKAERELAQAIAAVRPSRPDVMIGHPGAATSHERPAGTDEMRLVRAEPRYLIENKGGSSIYDLTTGFRTRDGKQEHHLDRFRAQIMKGGTHAEVASAGTIPESLLQGLPNDPVEGFLFWVRFRDEDDRRWEVVYDPVERDTTYERIFPTSDR